MAVRPRANATESCQPATTTVTTFLPSPSLISSSATPCLRMMPSTDQPRRPRAKSLGAHHYGSASESDPAHSQRASDKARAWPRQALPSATNSKAPPIPAYAAGRVHTRTDRGRARSPGNDSATSAPTAPGPHDSSLAANPARAYDAAAAPQPTAHPIEVPTLLTTAMSAPWSCAGDTRTGPPASANSVTEESAAGAGSVTRSVDPCRSMACVQQRSAGSGWAGQPSEDVGAGVGCGPAAAATGALHCPVLQHMNSVKSEEPCAHSAAYTAAAAAAACRNVMVQHQLGGG
jgi:hypothetical protein